jgi:hypothetical protein
MIDDNDKPPNAPGQTATATTERLIWTFYAALAAAILQTTLVLLGNEPDQSIWLLVLLALGIGQGLLLPSRFAWFGGLAVVVLWVMYRQATGTWIRAQLLQSTLEVGGLALSLVMIVRVRRGWEPVRRDLEELHSLREVLLAGEQGTGLLAPQVAELRLVEEVERARRFHRPLGLLLVEVEETAGTQPGGVQTREAHQALVRQLASVSLAQDIPIRLEENQVGLILPERSWESLYRDAESIVGALKNALFVDVEGQSHPVLDYLTLSFGLGTYQGELSGSIDLLRAARDSLSVSRDLAEIGQASVSAYAMPATPIVRAGPQAIDEEE